MKTTCLLFICLMLTTPAAALETLAINSRLDVDHALPGVPVSVHLTVSCDGPWPASLPSAFGILVTPEQGDTFVALPDSPSASLPDYYIEEGLSVQPGHTREFEVPLGQTLTGGFFAESRLWVPGRYRLELIFGQPSEVSTKSLNDLGGSTARSGHLIRSAPVELTVEEPIGNEARVWETVMERTSGRGFARISYEQGAVIAEQIFDSIPPQRYTPWIGVKMRFETDLEKAAHYEVLLANTPRDLEIGERLSVTVAYLRIKEAISRQRANPDDTASANVILKAYDELVDTSKESTSDSVRREATKTLGLVQRNETVTRVVKHRADYQH